MNPIDTEMYLMHSETEEYQDTINALNENITKAFSKYSQPYIAYSGGKDSLVMTHAVLQQCPETLVLHWDYGPYYMPRELEQEVLNIAQSIGATNLRVDSTGVYKVKKREAISVLGRMLYGRVMPGLKAEGYDLSFVGLRAQEGCKRARRVADLFENDSVLPNCFPVRHMKARDIWAYIINNKLPYCSHYDRYASILGYENVRFCTFFDKEFDKYGNSNIDGILMTQFKNVK
ncbi:MAG: phosphoadenosine phosphosulfate reductase family protein [Methanobacterium sp.]